MTTRNNAFSPGIGMKQRKGFGMSASTAPLHRQRGAFGIMAAFVLGLAVLFTALSVDTGRLMLEQRRLQKIADMAALDASSQTGSCGDGSLSSPVSSAQASAMRNGYAGNLTTETDGVVLGNIATNAGMRSFIPASPDFATAVQVTTRNTVPASLVEGGIFGNDVTLQSQAVAERQAIAGFSAGSLLLSLNSADSVILNQLLNETLGSNLSLNAVSYNGIADTQVKLADLVNASASAGTVNELLTSNVSVGELLQLYADAANLSGTASAGISSALGQLLTLNVPNTSLTVGDIIDVTTPNPEDAAEASVNLLDLITTTAIVANGSHAITLPVNISLPSGLLNVQALLLVIEPPQIAIGPPGKDSNGDWKTEVSTAQIRLNTDITSNISLLGLLSAQVDLGINLRVAQGSAWLESIQCRNLGSPASVVKIGAQPGIAALSISRSGGSGSSGEIIVRTLLLGDVAKVDVGLNVPVQNPSSNSLTYTVDTYDSDSLPQVQRASSTLGGSLNNGLSQLSDSLVLNATLLKIISLGLDQIISALVSNLLDPLLTQLATNLLDPLLRVLGIQVGSLDVQLFDLDESRPDLLI